MTIGGLILLVFVVLIYTGLIPYFVSDTGHDRRRTICRNNLHQLGIAFANYEETHGVFPPAFTSRVAEGPATAETGWGVLLLPFIEEAPLCRQYDFNIPAWDGPNETLSQSYLEQYECPTQATGDQLLDLGNRQLALTSYQPCFGSAHARPSARQEGVCRRNSSIRMTDIRDGTAQTILVGEVLSDAQGIADVADRPIPNFWAGVAKQCPYPVVYVASGTSFSMNSLPPGFGPVSFGSRHEGGAFFAFVDCQVRFIADDVDFTVYRALSTYRGGETIADEDY